MRKSLILMLSAAMLTLASCKKTIDNENKEEEKQTCTLIASNENDGTINKISYDDSGRVTMYSETYDETAYEIITYSYTPTQISEKVEFQDGNYNSTYQRDYTLDNTGKIISSKNVDSDEKERRIYTYNSDGYLSASGDIKYTWFDGNLSKSTGFEIVNYEYSSQLLPKNFFHFTPYFLPNELIGPLRNYFGKSVKNLPSKSTDKYNNETYTYTTDLGGNLTSVTTKNSATSIATSIINFKYNCK